MKNKRLTLLFFQSYYTSYIRAQSIHLGLSKNGVPMVMCKHIGPWLWTHPLSVLDFLKKVPKSDVVLANFRSFELLWLLRLLTKKPIIYDCFLSIWQTFCIERRTAEPDSFFGRLLFRWERYNLNIADHVLVDTQEHRKYLERTFDIPPEKISHIYISCESDVFKPQKARVDGDQTILWYGSGIPLQGLDVVYKAFRLAGKEDPRLRFSIVGSSKKIDELKEKAEKEGLTSIRFLGRVGQKEIVRLIGESSICLGGHYSDMEKARNVIAGKVFEIIASKRPVIVGRSPAVSELFTDGLNVLMCEMGDACSLKDAIIKLSNDRQLAKDISENAYRLFLEKLTPEKSTEELVRIIRGFA